MPSLPGDQITRDRYRLTAAEEKAEAKLTGPSVQAEFIATTIKVVVGTTSSRLERRQEPPLVSESGEKANMKALIATLAMTVGVAAPAAAADWDGDYYGHEHYGAVAVAPVAPVVVEPVVVAPVARVYVPPPPVYVAPVARVYATPYYHRRYVGYGGGWDHTGWGHGRWGHGGWGHAGWRHDGW
jgi:hypothetical protein